MTERSPEATDEAPGRSRAPVVLGVLAGLALLAATPWLVPAWQRYRVRRDVMRLVHERDISRLMPAAYRLTRADVDDLAAYWDPFCDGFAQYVVRFDVSGRGTVSRDRIAGLFERVAREDPSLVLRARAVEPLEPYAFRGLLLAGRLDLAAPEARDDELTGIGRDDDLAALALETFERACGGTGQWEGWADRPRHFGLLGDVTVEQARLPDEKSDVWIDLRTRKGSGAGWVLSPPVARDAGTCIARFGLADGVVATVALRVLADDGDEATVRWRILALEDTRPAD